MVSSAWSDGVALQFSAAVESQFGRGRMMSSHGLKVVWSIGFVRPPYEQRDQDVEGHFRRRDVKYGGARRRHLSRRFSSLAAEIS